MAVVMDGATTISFVFNDIAVDPFIASFSHDFSLTWLVNRVLLLIR